MAESEQTGDNMQADARRVISFVLPVYHEEGTLRALYEKITAAVAELPDDYELLFTAPSSASSDVETLARELDLPLSAIGKIGAKEEGVKDLVTHLDVDVNELLIEDAGQD